MATNYVRSFATLGMGDVALVGGKNASLGEMYQHLVPAGVKVPNGFAITADAYRYLLEHSGASARLHELLDDLDPDDGEELARRARLARHVVHAAELPDDLRTQILAGYHDLIDEYGPELSVAVRSSATAEDAPTASFAGQQETYLNVHGEGPVLDAVRRCFASLFTDRAIHYRADKGFKDLDMAMSVGVQKMVRSDIGVSGVMFTLDPDSGFRDVVLVSAAYGLGENVVQGAVDTDEFYVFKPTFNAGHQAVLRRSLGAKLIKMIYVGGGSKEPTRNVATSAADRARFCISDADVLTLAGYAIAIENHYSARAGHPQPMDIEWAKDGLDGGLYIVQARPETVMSQVTASSVVEEFTLRGSGEVLAAGRAVGTKIGSGLARVVEGPAQIAEFQTGEVLVTDSTTPDWEPVMKRSAAIVTNRGGRTCHAAIVARELGIPAVIGTGNGTETIRTGEVVTVSCAQGETGRVFRGAVPFDVTTTDTALVERPETKVMVILGNPDLAFKTAMLPNDGVGLARMEFVITEYIKAHPMALVHPDRVLDAGERAAIEALTRGYAKPADFFVERLAEGIGTIAAAFSPKPVIVRMSDFKTNEYASLLGGKWFEPTEPNPMIGFRGAARYTHEAYADGFALECAAMLRVRNDMGLTNVKLMIPFCRRAEEAERTIARMAELGLARGENGLEIYVMCEIPNNVIAIDEFSRHFDGFSIGSNDLTQLSLGVDRDSDMVAFDFDERDPGMLEMFRLAIVGAKRNGKPIGICGQAPSDYPEIAEFLVGLGIDSISLNPDSVVRTTQRILALEAASAE